MDSSLRYAPLRRTSALLVTAVTVIMLGVLLAPVFVAGPGQAAEQPSVDRRTISVSGIGTVRLEPDVADIQVGVVVERALAREAEEAAAGIMSAVVESLLAAGVDRSDLSTAWLSLEPVYDWSATTPRIVRYRMTDTVAVTVRDLARVGQLIDGAVDVGATYVSGITFRVDDPASVEALARGRAVLDARARADALADAAGVRIVGVYSITEGTVSGYPTPPDRSDDGSGGGTTPVLPGMVELSVTVSIVYEIG